MHDDAGGHRESSSEGINISQIPPIADQMNFRIFEFPSSRERYVPEEGQKEG